MTSGGPTVAVDDGFDGVGREKAEPPNTQVAVGPSHVLELTNGSINVWARSALGGQPIFHQETCSFFGVSWCTDPRAEYDPVSRRFFAVEESTNYIVVGVSAGADPTAGWSFEYLAASHISVDNPRLAITTDKVIIGDNGADYWVFEKQDYLDAKGGRVHARMVHRTNGNAVTGPSIW